MLTGQRLLVRRLGLQEYAACLTAMQQFTSRRGPQTNDELWLLQHPAVFTQGLNGKPEHVIDPGHIPVIQIDRGGQVTYHGPGQLVVYCLFDLRRNAVGVRALVKSLEQSVIDLAANYGISAYGRRDAPGVYVDGRKLASLGLRVRRGCSYHGLSLNVAMDLGPFNRINPCGYRGLEMTQLSDLGIGVAVDTVAEALTRHLASNLGYTVGATVYDLPQPVEQEF